MTTEQEKEEEGVKNWLGSRYFWGGLLIFIGLVVFLNSLDIVNFGGLIWAFILGIIGFGFLAIYFSNKENWWAIIPSFTFLSASLVIILSEFWIQELDSWGGFIVLFGIGLSFLVIYMTNHNHWWAFIPFGVLFSIAVSILLEPYLTDLVFIGVFFLGIGMTFGLLTLIPTPQGKMSWAAIPAGILFVIGLVFFFISGDLFRIIAAVLFIVFGVYVIVRTTLYNPKIKA